MYDRPANEAGVHLETMQTAGPNPDPNISPPVTEFRDTPDKADVDNLNANISEVDLVTIDPPPDGGRTAWLVVLGGFLLMFTSFGFSEFS